MNSALLNHELGHIAQQRESHTRASYISGCIGNSVLAFAQVWTAVGLLDNPHNVNLMEVNANARAGLPGNWQGTQVDIPDDAQGSYNNPEHGSNWTFQSPV